MKIFLTGLCILFFTGRAATQQIELYSPDSSLHLQIEAGKTLSYQLWKHHQKVCASASVDMELDENRKLSFGLAIKKKTITRVNEKVVVPVPYRRKELTDKYNQVVLQFRNHFAVQFRLYDNGMAYRIGTSFKEDITVVNEDASFDIDPQSDIWFALIDKRADVDRYHTSFEGRYRNLPFNQLPDTFFTYTPVSIVASAKKYLLSVSDANLYDYPGMFLSATKTGLKGLFAPYPAKEKMNEGDFPQLVVTERENFIAKTTGTRLFPWRVVMVADKDIDLVENDMLYLLGDKTTEDYSWVKPAKGTDEWITGVNLFNVPFKAGINTSTYKYYIDFAKQFGFDQVMMDAGWSDVKDLFKINPDVNMDTLAAYAKANGVRLMLWTLCSTLDRQLDSALLQFNKWGIHSIMTDFMDRDDQKTVNFYHRVAKACAENKMAVMFHGAYAPKGFNRTWPNAITHEGVLGAEFNIWSSDATPDHNVAIAYTRMLAGPLDYEPGLLLNAQPDQFKSVSKNPMSIGTRCQQLAMFVVYDSPLQIFSGNISQGLLDPAFMNFLGSIPTGWDETKVLQGRIGEYIVTARRKGKNWFVGGLNNSEERELVLPLYFLPDGNYSGQICTDGVNANSYGADYQIKNFGVNLSGVMKIKMASGGGFLIKFINE